MQRSIGGCAIASRQLGAYMTLYAAHSALERHPQNRKYITYATPPEEDRTAAIYIKFGEV